MRLLVLIPDLIDGDSLPRLVALVQRFPWLGLRIAPVRAAIAHPRLYTNVAWGGTINNMRHAAVARSLGVDTRLACPSGANTYGRFAVVDLPYLRWSDRRADDVVLLPDFCSELADEVRGPTIVYLQPPLQLKCNFDYRDDRIRLWTNSPHMLDLCRQVFPGKAIEMVPNVVDDKLFSFVRQGEREAGLLLAFPRKGADFIDATRSEYNRRGGRYWRFELVDGVSAMQVAQIMRRPQAFLASSEIDGCAMPPQEAMACGIVVVGRTAQTANSSMRHGETALVAETPEAAAECLFRIEDVGLRESLSQGGLQFIRRYFPDAEPRAHWRATLQRLGVASPA